jgi:hypothetical protein
MKINKMNKLIKLNLSNYSKRAYSSNIKKSYPNEVSIVEVGPRDGLQNEKVNFKYSFIITKYVKLIHSHSDTSSRRKKDSIH